jgi:uncharacterized YigZ family protein
MRTPARYDIPAETSRTEETILRSRFITTLGHADSVEGARAFIARVSEEFGDATHNCWAYVVGPPGDTSRVGMSDAGEPHGTAGRPMLDVLLGSGVGDIVAVVTRYYGGTKLGRGGLVRAYGNGVKSALESLTTRKLVRTVSLRVTVGYADVSPIKHALPQFEAEVAGEEYGTDVVLSVVLPVEHEEGLSTALAGLTNGRAEIERGQEATSGSAESPTP